MLCAAVRAGRRDGGSADLPSQSSRSSAGGRSVAEIALTTRVTGTFGHRLKRSRYMATDRLVFYITITMILFLFSLNLTGAPHQ
jgi:hypothetical protein